MELGLEGRVVLVTGAGQGIGRTVGEAFAAEGARVAFHFHSSTAGAEAAAAAVNGAGGRAIAVGADITDPTQVDAMVTAVTAELGPVDVLVNNAAATLNKPFLESTPPEWAPQIDVTVTGTLLVSHRVLRDMVGGGGGVLVNVMGDSGRVGESRLTVTAAARGSMVGFTKSLAKEFARHDVRANCVSLGLVRSERFDHHTGDAGDERMARILAAYPLRRLGHPADVAPMVLLLASDVSSWITGQVISVNGGYSMV